MSEETETKHVEAEKKPKFTPKPIRDARSPFEYHHFLGLILVIGFLVIGSAAGSYGFLKDLMVAPCLGCLGLYPNVELEFTFDTVDDQDHPEFVLNHLKSDGPIFIEFTQNDENCPPCARMRPKIGDLEKEFNDRVQFNIININENENTKFYKGEKQIDTISDSEYEQYYHIYDIGNIAGGRVATPTFIIITLGEYEEGVAKPIFAVGYGEYKEEDAQKTKEDLANALEVAIGKFYKNKKWYTPEELII